MTYFNKKIIILFAFSIARIALAQTNCNINPEQTTNIYKNSYINDINSQIDRLSKLKITTTDAQIKLYSNTIKIEELIAKNKNINNPQMSCEKNLKDINLLKVTSPDYVGIYSNLSSNKQKIIDQSNCYGKISCDLLIEDMGINSDYELMKYSEINIQYVVLNVLSYMNYSTKKSSGDNTLKDVEVSKANNELNSFKDIINAGLLTTKDTLKILEDKKEIILSSYKYHEDNKIALKINYYNNLVSIINGINLGIADKKTIDEINKYSFYIKESLAHLKADDEKTRLTVVNLNLPKKCSHPVYCFNQMIVDSETKTNESINGAVQIEERKEFRKNFDILNNFNSEIPPPK